MKAEPTEGTDRILAISVLGERFSICRLEAGVAVPAWATGSSFVSVTRTEEELSVVCPEEVVPVDVAQERGWRALKLEGPFEFSIVGILASIAAPLAEAGVAIFALSTFDTDYVLIKGEQLETAVSILRGQGYEFRDTDSGVVIEPASDDEHFLWEMLYEAVHWGPEESGPKPPPEELLAEPGLRRYVEGWGRAGDFAVVARDSGDGRRIGAAWYRLFSADHPGFGFVDAATPDIAIAIAPDRRGTGVGGALLVALMEAARLGGFHAISLSVQKSNPAAIKLYEKNGFVRFRDDGGAWVMRAELDDNATTDDAPGV